MTDPDHGPTGPRPLVATVQLDDDYRVAEPIRLTVNGTDYPVPDRGRRNQTTVEVRISEALQAAGYECADSGDRRQPGGDVRRSWVGANGILVHPAARKR